MRIFAILLLTTACSIERDVPNFVYPTSGSDPNGDFPKLLPVDQIARADDALVEKTILDSDDLIARARGLANRTVQSPRASISRNRIASLRARAAALRAAPI